jgi:hypothetical protein
MYVKKRSKEGERGWGEGEGGKGKRGEEKRAR